MLSDVNVSFFYIKNWGVKKMKGRESGSTEEVGGLRPVGARPTRPRFRRGFLIFIFFKNVFLQKYIFSFIIYSFILLPPGCGAAGPLPPSCRAVGT